MGGMHTGGEDQRGEWPRRGGRRVGAGGALRRRATGVSRHGQLGHSCTANAG